MASVFRRAVDVIGLEEIAYNEYALPSLAQDQLKQCLVYDFLREDTTLPTEPSRSFLG